MQGRWPEIERSAPKTGWWVVLPTAILVLAMLLLSGFCSTAAASEADAPVAEPLLQGNPPACASCHPAEDAAYKDSMHANQSVTCEACHGPYKEGHPAAATMQLPMASETCQTCHQGTFDEWGSSSHAGKNIECFDCHLSHTQGLRLETEEKLCSACHADQQTELAHATHGINGVDCAACHMSPVKASTGAQGEALAANHSFQVGSDVCTGCHKSSVHSAASTGEPTAASGKSSTQLEQEANRVPALQADVNRLQQQVDNVRNLGVVGMGLTFGAGGFFGLIAGIVGAIIWIRRRGGI